MYFDAFLTHSHLAWLIKIHPNICWLGCQVIKGLVLESPTSPHGSIGIVPSYLSRSADVTPSNSNFVSLTLRPRHFDVSRNAVCVPVYMNVPRSPFAPALHPRMTRINIFLFLVILLARDSTGLYLCYGWHTYKANGSDSCTESGFLLKHENCVSPQ
jgi:hypothetical protein